MKNYFQKLSKLSILFMLTVCLALPCLTSCDPTGTNPPTGKITKADVDKFLPGGYWVHSYDDEYWWGEPYTEWYIIQIVGKEKYYSATVYKPRGEILTLEDYENNKIECITNRAYEFDEKTQKLTTPELFGKLIKLTATEFIIEHEDWGTMKFTKYQTLP